MLEDKEIIEKINFLIKGKYFLKYSIIILSVIILIDLLTFLLYPLFFEEIGYKKLFDEQFFYAIKIYAPFIAIAMIIIHPIFIIELIIFFGIIISVFFIYKNKKLFPYLIIMIFCMGINNILGMVLFHVRFWKQ
jgi:hypothetical protein